MKAYQTDITTLTQTLNVDPERGLSSQEVAKRQEAHGYNTLKAIKQRTVFSIFISQFQNPLVYILFLAALIIFIFGQDKLDAFIISGVLFFNAILGTIQEARTKNIIENLKQYIKTESVVLRNGSKTVVDEKDLVVGDIIFLQEGERVPADARVIVSNNLSVEEAILTGESRPTEKITDALEHEALISDQKNTIFKGTYIVMGGGKAIVTAIGTDTEIGKIQVIAEEIDTDIPLRKELERLSHWILIFILITCLFLFVIGIATGKPIKELLVMLTALFICVVPEGLPVVLSLVLVAGALQMAKHFVLVRNMQAVEALGRTDVIVIDKTGTLTRNEMIVSYAWTPDGFWHISGQGYQSEGKFFKTKDHPRIGLMGMPIESRKMETITRAPGGEKIEQGPQQALGLESAMPIDNFTDHSSLRDMGIATALLNNAEIIPLDKHDSFDIKGDPTEAALFVFSQKMGAAVTQHIPDYTKIHEIPFNSALRYHAGFYKKNNEGVIFIIGSPETVLKRTSNQTSDTTRALDSFLEKGLRVVAIGIQRVPLDTYDGIKKPQDYENLLATNDITLLGFAGIEDSIRTEVASVIQGTRDAGVSIIMATGDHHVTALHVAQQVGIFRNGDDYVDGSEIDALSDENLLRRINQITVFSRVSPQHKMRIVQLLQKSGHIVAMTGDGINDAPSLVAADLGIAMGSSTEVAKQAADLVLLNDSFINIVDAIEQGRHIFYTLKRIVLYFFSTNMAEILIVFFALVAGLFTQSDIPLPITAVQILWLNLVTDGFLDVGLSMEPKEPGLLKNAWLRKKQRLIDTNLLLKMLWMSIPMGIGSLLIFLWFYDIDLAHARTMTLITMAMYQWFNAWNCRSETRSLWQLGLFSNKWLIAVMALVLFLQSAIVYVPFMRHIFKTVPLSGSDWIIIIAITAPIVALEEVRKAIAQKWAV